MTLQRWGERWPDALALRTSFDGLAREMVEELQARKAMRDAAAEQARQQHQHQHQQHQQHQHQLQQQNQQHQQQMQQQNQQQPQQFGASSGQHQQLGGGVVARMMQGQSVMGPPGPVSHEQQQQQHQQQHQQQTSPQQEVRWVDVDVAQIIRGGGGI
jgi:hypothetical protein